MLAIERKHEILDRLRREQRVLVSELAALYGVTEETIRRDLDKLEKEGYATKTYGGAIWGNSTKTDLSTTIRNKTNVEAKRTIGALMSRLILDGDHLVMDHSSTSLSVAKALRDKRDLTVVTNSMEIILELSSLSSCKVHSTGGVLRPESLALVGPQCVDSLSQFHVDKAILSCKGLDRTGGVTDSNEQHAAVKRAMIAAASQAILVLDSSKFDKISFVKIAGITSFSCIVTNRKPDEPWLEFLDRHGIRCLYPTVPQP